MSVDWYRSVEGTPMHYWPEGPYDGVEYVRFGTPGQLPPLFTREFVDESIASALAAGISVTCHPPRGMSE